MPMGLAVADMLAGAHLAQGILACLVRRGVTGEGGLVEVSLLETVLDLQFEVLTTHLNDGGKLPRAQRGQQRPRLPRRALRHLRHRRRLPGAGDDAGPTPRRTAGLPGAARIRRPADAGSTERDEIKAILADHLRSSTTAAWLAILEPADVWCADVLTWPQTAAPTRPSRRWR